MLECEYPASHIMARITEFGSRCEDYPLYIEADTGRVLPW